MGYFEILKNLLGNFSYILEAVLGLLKKKPLPVEQKVPVETKVESGKPLPKKIVTLEQYLTACDRYPERAKDPVITDQMLADAQLLIDRVTDLMKELGISQIDITSGYRPAEVNAKVGNAAQKSAHLSCQAMDILDDKEQTLAHKLTEAVLEKYNLWMESPLATRGKNTNWCHLQIRPAHKRIFIP